MLLSTVLGGALVLAQGAGSTSANFQKIGAGARAVGMGEAFAAVANDSTALYWNPAGLALFRGTGFSATHGEWMQGVQHEYLALTHRFQEAGGVGASLNYLSSGHIRQTLEAPGGGYGGEGGLVTGAAFAGSVAYAQRLGFWWPGLFLRRSVVGVKATYLGQRAVKRKSEGASFDLGYIYELKPRKTYVALVMLNLGTQVYRASQPLLFRIGFSHRVRNLLGRNDQLTLSGEADGHMDTGFKAGFGMEYRRRFGRQTLSLRSGYRLGGSLGALAGLVAGAGYETPLGEYDMGLDYAFVPYGILGLTHRVALSLKSGGRILPPEADLAVPPSFYIEKRTGKTTQAEEGPRTHIRIARRRRRLMS